MKTILLFLTALVLVGCNPKAGKQISHTTAEVDTTAIVELRYKNSELEEYNNRILRENRLLKVENATLQSGTLEKDSVLPVKTFRVSSGEAYFEANYQGFINSYALYTPERKSETVSTFDSSSVFKNQLLEVMDSLGYYKNLSKTSDSVTIITPPKVNWFVRTWRALVSNFWMILIGAVILNWGWRWLRSLWFGWLTKL